MVDEQVARPDLRENSRFAGTAMLVVAALLGFAMLGGLVILPEETRTVLARPLAGNLNLGQLTGALILGLLLGAFSRSELAATLWRTLTEEVMTNWQLFLLGLTGLVLSLASGYTTWDGMTNFTGDAILSLMITFGIQGIMLIAAWLIGESFAVGMAGGRGSQSAQRAGNALVGAVLTIAAAVLIAVVVVILFDSQFGTKANTVAKSLMRGYDKNRELVLGVGAAALAMILIGIAVGQREIVTPYLRGLKIILSSLPIWLMFLSCATTSVFFSFDSLFSTIFPQEERKRAGDLRTLNQVSGLVAEVGTTIGRRRLEEIDRLFTSEEWREYEGRLNDLIKIARKAPDAIRSTILRDLADRQAVTAGLQEKKASAESQKFKLEKRKEELLANVNSLKSEVTPIAAEVDGLKSKLFQKDRDIVARKAAAESEARGVGDTGKAGRGPKFKELNDALKRAQEERAVLALQLKEFDGRLQLARDSVATAQAELAQIDGELGKLRGETEVADQQMSVQSGIAKSEAAPSADGSGGLDSLEIARSQFRQSPERASFDAVHKHCNDLLKTFERVGELKSEAEAKGARCDPGIVAEQAAKVFALSAGLERHMAGCGKGENLPQTGGADQLLDFSAKCVQDSGLTAEDTAEFRGKLNRVALSRDDKAHRFVVSWNAFLDGNQLAYLALAIAIALDALVFMSGLFGANAVRSTLADLPHGRRRSAAQLQSIIDTALLPDRFGNARLVIESMRPITRDAAGHVGEVVIDDVPSELLRAQLRKSLSAGATINAVSRDPADPGRYLVRAEFYEYLAEVCERELKSNRGVREAAAREREVAEGERRTIEREQIKRQASDEAARLKENEDKRSEQRLAAVREQRVEEVKPMLRSALLPDIHRNSGIVLETMHPVEQGDFTSEIVLDEVADEFDLKMLRRVLNAGSALKLVRRPEQYRAGIDDEVTDQRRSSAAAGRCYVVRPEFVICMNRIHQETFDPNTLPVVRSRRPPLGDVQRRLSRLLEGAADNERGDASRIVGMQSRLGGGEQRGISDRQLPRPRLSPDLEEDDAEQPARPQPDSGSYFTTTRGEPQPRSAQVEFASLPSFEFLSTPTEGSPEPVESQTAIELRQEGQLVNRYVRALIDRLVPYNSVETLRELSALQSEQPIDFENIDEILRRGHPKLASQIEISRSIWMESLNSKYTELRSETGSANRPALERAMGRVASLAPISACNDVYKSLSLELDAVVNGRHIEQLLGNTKNIGRRVTIEKSIEDAETFRSMGMKELPSFASSMYALQEMLAAQNQQRPTGAQILKLKPPQQ